MRGTTHDLKVSILRCTTIRGNVNIPIFQVLWIYSMNLLHSFIPSSDHLASARAYRAFRVSCYASGALFGSLKILVPRVFFFFVVVVVVIIFYCWPMLFDLWNVSATNNFHETALIPKYPSECSLRITFLLFGAFNPNEMKKINGILS